MQRNKKYTTTAVMNMPYFVISCMKFSFSLAPTAIHNKDGYVVVSLSLVHKMMISLEM
jgi:hypothetical protein